MVIDITTKFAGLDLNSPIIIASSGLTNSTQHFKDFEKNGAGAIVLKSIYEEEIIFEQSDFAKKAESYGYDNENLDYLDYKIKQQNINKYLSLVKEAKSKVSIPIIASVNCITSNEWTDFTKKIVEAGADAIELNIFFIPNRLNKTSQEIEDSYVEIIEKVRKTVRVPLIIKMSQYFTNLGDMIHRVSKLGVDGIVLFNKYYSPDIDINTQEITVSNVFSNPSDMSLPLRWVALTSGTVDCSIAASTGIHDGEAVIKMIMAGASAVEIASSIYKHGAKHIKEMNDTLIDFLKFRDLESMKQIKGQANQINSKDSEILERVQFMKYFTDNENDII